VHLERVGPIEPGGPVNAAPASISSAYAASQAVITGSLQRHRGAVVEPGR
jgi:hypothetical protein